MIPAKNYLAFSCIILLLTACHEEASPPLQATADTSTAGTQAILPAAAVSVLNIGSLTDAYTNNIAQVFVAKQEAVTVLTGRHGLKVTVDPGVLETLDGRPVNGDITVKMVELTNPEELFKSNAATISNGSLLVSGGSYFIGMQCKGQELRVKGNRSVQMQLPKIREQDMELFYGKRDAGNNMNWQQAETPLIVSSSYQVYDPPYPREYTLPRFRSKYKMFDSLTTKVFFMNRHVTIKQMVDCLQQRGVDKNIDSISIPWESFYGRVFESSALHAYAPLVKKYRILTCRQMEEEKDSIARLYEERCRREEANRKYDAAWQEQYAANSVEGQLQKYYAPVGVTSLGWINCDRFYNQPQNSAIPLEIPYTLQHADLQYFLIYQSFNGLMSGRLYPDDKGQYSLSKLPQGQAVTLVLFAKGNGQFYECKETFVIQPGKKIRPAFNTITAADLTKRFGANVKI